LEPAHPFRRLGLVPPEEDPDQEQDQKADDDPIEPVLPLLLLSGDAAADQEEHGHPDRRRGGDSAEERERVPLRIRAGREEGRGDDLWAGAHHDGHGENRPESLHQSSSLSLSRIPFIPY
jgi:hypothetical protein